VQVLSGIGLFLLVTGGAFVGLVIFASFLRFQHLAQRAAVADAEEMDAHDILQVKIAHRLGTAHRAPEPFCVMLLRPDGLEALTESQGPAAGEEVLARLEELARRAVRSRDDVLRYTEQRVAVVVDAPRSIGPVVARRVLEFVRRDPLRFSQGGSARVTASAGLASHPENGDRFRELIALASAALDRASVAGPAGLELVAESAAGGEAPSPEPGAAAPAPVIQRGLVDPLTGVLKQERLPVALQKYVASFRKNGDPVSVVVLDVDHLARYNGHYGREAGDGILRGLGELLQRSVREADLVARLGGDEFLVAMGCAPRDALTAGQRLVGLVKKNVFTIGSHSLRITVSGGVAGYPDHGGNPRYLIESADAALHTAKEKGGGVCLLYGRTMQEPAPVPEPKDVF
jgi:diguanylate cyclase (GGDEF)-like protein